MYKNNLIILTATITPPPGAPNLARTDPALRLQDYTKALEFYLDCLSKKIITGIVFFDNSASDISSLQLICKQHHMSESIELLSFNGLDYPLNYGRGYGEFKLIDYVMTNSRLIKLLPPEANIWKVTGRYILNNLKSMIKSIPRKSDFYCNFRNIPTYWIDLYLLCWNKKSYAEIINNIYTQLNEKSDGRVSEQYFREILDKNNYQSKIYKRFKCVPDLVGIRGFDGQGYKEMNIKFIVRKIANSLMPWVWI